jgi:hypothetical protein
VGPWKRQTSTATPAKPGDLPNCLGTLIGDKPIGAIRRPDLKLLANHLRDRANPRGGKLNQKTIIRSLAHIKAFMDWAVASGLAVIRDRKPQSVAELVKMTGRKPPNVLRTLGKL